MLSRFFVKFVLTSSFLIFCQESVFSAEDRGFFSCFSNNGILSDWVYKRLEDWHNSHKKLDDDYPINPKIAFSENIELAKNPDYASVCLIQWTDGTSVRIGTGVLTEHSKFPDKKGILTAAHVVDENYGCYTVRFPRDSEPRKVVRGPKIISDKIDLGLLFLGEYPPIEPAKRSDIGLQRYTPIFGHSAGYGGFTLPDEKNWYSDVTHKVCRGTIIVPNRGRHCHVVANNYFVTEHLPWSSANSHLGGLFLQSSSSGMDEKSRIIHPVSGVRIPRSFIIPGFSGSPVFSQDNKVIAINAAYDVFSIDSYPNLSRMHTVLYTIASIYNKISSWSREWVLGDNAHYIYTAALSYCLLQKMSNRVNPTFLKGPPNNIFSYGNAGRYVLPILAMYFVNIVGGGLSKFKYRFPVYNVVDSEISRSQAVILKNWNTQIDECLSENK